VCVDPPGVDRPPAGRLDLEDLGLLALEHLVDALHVLVRELLHAILGAVHVVCLRLARAIEVLEVVQRVAAHVAHGDAALLGDVARNLDELLAAVLGELRERRRMPPSLAGLRPRSDSSTARSISLIALLSYGVIVSRRASGTLICASWLSGVLVP
jgi:hypothetical protein